VTILHCWQASNGWSFTAHNTLESGTSMGTLCESYISTTQVSVKIHRIHNAWTNWNWQWPAKYTNWSEVNKETQPTP